MKKWLSVICIVLLGGFSPVVWSEEAVSPSLFTPKQSFCDREKCRYENKAPGTVLILHGMNSSMNTLDAISKKPNGNYIRLAQFIEQLGKGNPAFKVYGVDYNSDGSRAKGSVKIQPLRSPLPSSCTPQKDWKNCWDDNKKWESGDLYETSTLTIRTVSDALQQQLIKMAQAGAITNPVTIINHSMGGLVTRDLLYASHHSKVTGYEVLRENGVVINEVITLGTPHDHGFTGSELADYRKLSCKVLDPSVALLGQFCMLTEWINQQQNASTLWSNAEKVEINKLDYPQIHWVATAGLGMTLPDGAPGDGLVSIPSALYEKNNLDRFHRKVGLKTSASPHYHHPVPGDLSAGFPQGTDAIHENLYNVGMFPNPQNCASSNLKYPTIACTGFFQYVVPQTTLCLLPGYNAQNPYYRDNPAFSPAHWGCLR